MRHLGYTAPDQLRCRLKGLSVPALVAEGIKLRPTRSADPVTAATKASLSSLAHRISCLDDACVLKVAMPPEIDGAESFRRSMLVHQLAEGRG
jgi:hypothetical protein